MPRTGLRSFLALFDCFDFAQTPDMSFFTGKLRTQVALKKIDSDIATNRSRPPHRNIHTVVLYTLLCGIMVVAQPARTPLNGFAAADTPTPLPQMKSAVLDLFRHQLSKVRVVVWLIRSYMDYRMA
jgi:hypothetical protein